MKSLTDHSFAESPQLALDFLAIPAPHDSGRKELGERFMNAGSVALADYEMLALVLARAVSQGNVRTLAKRLLAEFGDFNHVISASTTRLARVAGMDPLIARELKIIEAAAHRLGQARVLGKNVITSWSELMNYCKISMAHRETEQFRIFFLDRKNTLIADEAQSKGTVDHVPVYPREVAKRALELNASAVILVHNHPSGDPTPSAADISMTHKIDAALDTLGVTLHDHIIVGKGNDTSFRSLGLL